MYLNDDLVCKGGDFFAYWDGNIWQTNFNSLVKQIDTELYEAVDKMKEKNPEFQYIPLPLNKHNTKSMTNMLQFLKQSTQSTVQFNSTILFADSEPKRSDYATHILSYNPVSGPTDSFDELFSVLYEQPEMTKILWFIGATLAGDMPKIQKFLFLYGAKGTGKGTILKVIKKIFEAYHGPISLKDLTGSSEFATSEIKELPVLIDEECDLSTIKNDTYLLKLTAHEPININAKYKQTYQATFNGLLVAASNERYKVKHVDAGITRRAVVAEPTNKTVDSTTYHRLMKAIDFEIPHIAQKAIDVYKDLGFGYYDNYVDIATLEATDHVYSFVEEYRERLGDPCTLKAAAEMYKEYLEDIQFDTMGYKRRIKQALLKYYVSFDKETRIDGVKYNNVYSGFKDELFSSSVGTVDTDEIEGWIRFDGGESILDAVLEHNNAQLTTANGTPKQAWENVVTRLEDIDTRELHFVKVDPQHIVIDFDLRGPNGDKSLKESMKAANEFPPTYAEVSKSGQGIHLHYFYDGDVDKLSSLYDHQIEIKVFKGNSSLRRKLTLCNNKQIVTLSTGLPLKEESNKMYDSISDIVWTEKKMRVSIERNLRKEYHDSTKSSIDFIDKILKDAQEAGIEYDLMDMREAVMAFAMSATNQSITAMRIVNSMNFTTVPEPETPEHKFVEKNQVIPKHDLWFYDVEVYKNYFIICAKRWHSTERIRLVNPTKEEVEDLLRKPLVAFNNLRYDNHIMYGALMGEDNLGLYMRSQKLINNERGGTNNSAYGASYLDLYEMATKKQSLKKWQVELGIDHEEMEHPWDEPLPDELLDKALGYCDNDVDATEALFDHLEADYNARIIIATISGLPINAKTQQHAAEILFEGDKKASKQFVYTDLSEEFPGYSFAYGKSDYNGEDPKEGGYVHAKPGVHENVDLYDIRSMHPFSIIALNLFGKYTDNFKGIVDARVAVKLHDFDEASKLFNGALQPFLKEETADDLAYSLKIIINIIYGMTSAKFKNAFTVPGNVDNIVAKRGSLFMMKLKRELETMGLGDRLVHVKTDSVKIVDSTPEIKDFIFDFGLQYGYIFEHEATYERMALVNDAVYIAKVGWAEKAKKIGKWEAIGTMMIDPFVYKKLFSKEDLEDEDFMLTKSAKSAHIYLSTDGVSHDTFIGKVAKVYPSKTGYDLIRYDAEKDKQGFVSGSKGFKWREATDFRGVKDIDMNYFDTMAIKAIEKIDSVGPAYKMLDDCPVEYLEHVLPFEHWEPKEKAEIIQLSDYQPVDIDLDEAIPF
jgi:energy-coupling factor transporter ATP-binding protein EcfA2